MILLIFDIGITFSEIFKHSLPMAQNMQVRFEFTLRSSSILQVQYVSQGFDVITIPKTDNKDWIFKTIKSSETLRTTITKFFIYLQTQTRNNTGDHCRVSVSNIQIHNGYQNGSHNGSQYSKSLFDFPINYDQFWSNLISDDTTDDYSDDVPDIYPSEIRRKQIIKQ